MTVAILTIGTELTRGELVDSNSAWLSDELTALGLEVTEHSSVDDEPDRIVAAIERLSRSADFVFATGGLGPTSDDLSAASAARAAGVSLTRRPEAVAHLKALYEKRGRTLSEANLAQADLPDGADILHNPVGSAPGFSLVLGECRFFFMPGVPREMRAIFAEIRSTLPKSSQHRHQVHLRTYGLPESQVGERLDDVESLFPGVTLGFRASFPEVEVKVLAAAKTEAEAMDLAQRASGLVRERLGSYIYGSRQDTLAGVVGHALKERGLTLALAESCTGGSIASMLTDVPGSSSFFLLGAVTYANSAKSGVLGVEPSLIEEHGAVSEACAQAMALGACRVAGSDLSLSVTGIAGPGGGSAEKPVGTVWFGVGRGGHVEAIRKQFRGDRERVRRGAAFFGLRALLRAAEGVELKDVFTHT